MAISIEEAHDHVHSNEHMIMVRLETMCRWSVVSTVAEELQRTVGKDTTVRAGLTLLRVLEQKCLFYSLRFIIV